MGIRSCSLFFTSSSFHRFCRLVRQRRTLDSFLKTLSLSSVHATHKCFLLCLVDCCRPPSNSFLFLHLVTSTFSAGHCARFRPDGGSSGCLRLGTPVSGVAASVGTASRAVYSSFVLHGAPLFFFLFFLSESESPWLFSTWTPRSSSA